MIEQESVNRAIHALRKVVLEPGAVEPAHTRMAVVFPREEHHHPVPGEQLHHVFGAIEIDVVPVGPVQASNRIDVLELSDTVLQNSQPLFEICHTSPALVCGSR